MNQARRYIERVISDLNERFPWEIEYDQAVAEFLFSIEPVLEREKSFEEARVLERLVVPERMHTFRVVWTDDTNRVQTNYGYRVQFNSALGPFMGGTHFHASVNMDLIKFLGFETVFKNALTGLPFGGGMGGADVDTHSLSQNEMIRFCQSYIGALFRHIGPNVDVPGSGEGVGTREIGYLLGSFKRLAWNFGASFTGKSTEWGGSNLRPESTGYGVVYFAQNVLEEKRFELRGSRMAVSGFGTLASSVIQKALAAGARIVAISGSDGFVYQPDGVTQEGFEFIRNMKYSGRDEIWPYAERFNLEYVPGKKPWNVPCDIAIPCAFKDEIEKEDAEALIHNGCLALIEGTNRATTPVAIQLLQDTRTTFVPGKAANAGGVVVSALEINQNQMGVLWSSDEVDARLQVIMKDIHDTCLAASTSYGDKGNYLMGANISSFERIANAMIEQGAL